jgi:hypothetical protein
MTMEAVFMANPLRMKNVAPARKKITFRIQRFSNRSANEG